VNVLINTTVLSNFAAIDRLDLLQVLYKQIYMAYPVYIDRHFAQAGFKILTA